MKTLAIVVAIIASVAKIGCMSFDTAVDHGNKTIISAKVRAQAIDKAVQ